MHGLVNRLLQHFLQDTQGPELWRAVALSSGVGESGFDVLAPGDGTLTEAVLDAAAAQTGCDREALLEDLGTYLVSHPRMSAVRRLLRFGGVCFEDFVRSLEDLPGRTRLAVPDLVLPGIDVDALAPGCFRLRLQPGLPGLAPVLMGMLRAMGDDYGALVLIEEDGGMAERRDIRIDLLDPAFAEARHFALSGPGDRRW